MSYRVRGSKQLRALLKWLRGTWTGTLLTRDKMNIPPPPGLDHTLQGLLLMVGFIVFWAFFISPCVTVGKLFYSLIFIYALLKVFIFIQCIPVMDSPTSDSSHLITLPTPCLSLSLFPPPLFSPLFPQLHAFFLSPQLHAFFVSSLKTSKDKTKGTNWQTMK